MILSSTPSHSILAQVNVDAMQWRTRFYMTSELVWELSPEFAHSRSQCLCPYNFDTTRLYCTCVQGFILIMFQQEQYWPVQNVMTEDIRTDNCRLFNEFALWMDILT